MTNVSEYLFQNLRDSRDIQFQALLNYCNISQIWKNGIRSKQLTHGDEPDLTKSYEKDQIVDLSS